jgi:transcriptional repressor NrdR
MKCPFCALDETIVVDSREAEDQTTIRRRRACTHCDKRFTTYERIEGLDLKVIKKDGIKEDFSRDKLRRGIVKATWKRPVPMATIETLIDEGLEVKSWEIGNLVINRLKKIDKLSYLLFASVYRDFDSLDDFAQELKTLQEE